MHLLEGLSAYARRSGQLHAGRQNQPSASQEVFSELPGHLIIGGGACECPLKAKETTFAMIPDPSIVTLRCAHLATVAIVVMDSGSSAASWGAMKGEQSEERK